MPAGTPMRVSTRIAPRTCKSPVARHGACFPARALAVVVADLVAGQDDEQERGSETAAPRPERAPDQLRRRLPLAKAKRAPPICLWRGPGVASGWRRRPAFASTPARRSHRYLVPFLAGSLSGRGEKDEAEAEVSTR